MDQPARYVPHPSGVVAKIIRLCDRSLVLRLAGKSHRPEVQAELAEIGSKLATIRRTCSTSWAKAAEILHPGRTA